MQTHLEQLEVRVVPAASVQMELFGAYNLDSYAGVGFQENPVATLQARVDGQADTKPGDFKAQIQWGDGGTSTGDVIYQRTSGTWGEFLIKGSHTYQKAGSQIPVMVTVTGPAGTTSSLASNDLDHADVVEMPSGIPGTEPPSSTRSHAPQDVQIQVHGGFVRTSYTGVGFQENDVATMSVMVDGQPGTTLSDYHPQINWGDSNTWTAGDLVYQGTSGTWANYLVKGSHVYQKNGSAIPIVVYVSGPDGTSTTVAANNVDQGYAVAMPSGIPGTQPPSSTRSHAPADVQIQVHGGFVLSSYGGVGFQENEVATMSVMIDGQPGTTLSDYHPQINWGDSATWTAGDLVYQGTSGTWANYLVKGSHVYQKPQSAIPVVVYVTGPDGTSASLAANNIDQANVVPMPSGIPGTPPPASPRTLAPADVQIQVHGGYVLNSYAGVGFQESSVATISVMINGQPGTSLGDFHPQINWGDSAAWTAGDLVSQGTSGTWANYLVRGSHIYQKPGTGIPVIVYVSGPDGTSAAFASNNIDKANVSPNPNGLSLGDLNPTQWDQNQPGYAGTIPVNGGSGGYKNLHVGGLPAGLTATIVSSQINGQQTGTISIDGTPTQSGTFTLQVSLVDGNNHSLQGTYSLKINTAFSLGTLTPPHWTINQPGYNGLIAIRGGTGSYSALSVSGLPAGLSAKVSGNTIVVSGTPTQTGTFSKIAVSLQDSNHAQASATETLTINSVVVLGSLNPTRWLVNQASYAGTIGVTGGSGKYGNLKVTGLPAGLSAVLSGSSVRITGTPTAAGTFNSVAVSLTDNTGAPASHTYSLTILAANTRLTITPATLPTATAGQNYQATLSATGGSGNYRFTISAGSLPPGIYLSSTGGVSGASNVSGKYTFTVQATDNTVTGLTGSQAYTLTVQAAALAKVIVTAPANVNAGTGFKVTVRASDRFGNTVTTTNGPYRLSASDGQTVTPASVQLTGGTGSTTVTLGIGDVVTLVADSGTTTGVSGSIVVKPKGTVPLLKAEISFVEDLGQPLSGQFATLHDDTAPTGISGTIQYGDGTPAQAIKLTATGNGNYSVQGGPHAYFAPGTYQITLTLNDSAGNRSRGVDHVSVTPGPTSIVGNAETLAALIFKGYDKPATGPKTPIAIAPVLNRGNTYLLTLSGTDFQPNQATGLPEDVLSSIDQMDKFRAAALNAVRSTVPRGATLIIAGHSLGGMEGQNLVPDLLAAGYHVSNVITYGSPVTAIPMPGVQYQRFSTPNDLVPKLSPLGLYFSTPQGALAAQLAHLNQTIIPTNGWIDPISEHLAYATDPALAAYDALGSPDGTAVLQLGPIKRFAVPQ